jgi:hypothetical protein
MSPGRQSEIDLILRPIRSAMYGLIAQENMRRDDDDGNGIVIVTECVRTGHDNVPVEVEALSTEIIASALGSSDLRFLLKFDEQQRKKMMLSLIHLSVNPLVLSATARDNDFVNHDPILTLPAHMIISNDIGIEACCIQRSETLVPYQAIGIIFRVLLLMCENHREQTKHDEESAEYIDIGVGECEALMKQIVLLNCGVDISNLPEILPSPHTVQVAALFLATVSAVTELSELLDLQQLIPEPARLFSGI